MISLQLMLISLYHHRSVLTLSLLPITLLSMKVIGLTGGIGSGKSEIARFLKDLGAGTIDADKVGHEVLYRGTPCWQKLVDTFGKEICDTEGNIDRKILARIVFKNQESMIKLNQITHPMILDEIKIRLKKLEDQGYKVAVVEAALLIEAGWAPYMDQIWLSLAPKGLTLRRLEKRGLNEAEAAARIAAQIPGENKINQATVVINNNGSLSDLKERVVQLWNSLDPGSNQ
jgi:dephospho-CoA kinase